MGFFAYLFGVVYMANALVAKATLLMLGIALFFKAATKATDEFWRFRNNLRKHKKSRPKNDQKH